MERFILFDYYYGSVFFSVLVLIVVVIVAGAGVAGVAFFAALQRFQIVWRQRLLSSHLCVQLLNGAIPESIIWLDILMCLNVVFFVFSLPVFSVFSFTLLCRRRRRRRVKRN